MGVIQTDGTSAVTGSTTVNNGGTVLNGGDIGQNSPFTKNISIKDNAIGSTSYGSAVVSINRYNSADHYGVIKAKGTGSFAFYPNSQEGERNFLIRNAGSADGNNKVNNSVESSLATPGSEYASVGIRSVNAIHKVLSTSLLGSDADASFNVLARPSSAMVPGRTKGTGYGNDSNFTQADGTGVATDDAASPTRSVPGELTYHFGGLAKPTTDEYKAIDSYEV